MSTPHDPHGVAAAQKALAEEKAKLTALAAEIDALKKSIDANNAAAAAANALVTAVARALVPPPPPPPPPVHHSFNSNANSAQAKAAVTQGREALASLAALIAKIAEMELVAPAIDLAEKALKAAEIKASASLPEATIKIALTTTPPSTPGATAVCAASTATEAAAAQTVVIEMKVLQAQATAAAAAAKSAMETAVTNRVNQLTHEGHAPQRHLFPTPAQLAERALYKINPETGLQMEFDTGAGRYTSHACEDVASKFNDAADFVLAEAALREEFIRQAVGTDASGLPTLNLTAVQNGVTLPLGGPPGPFPPGAGATIVSGKQVKAPPPPPPATVWANVGDHANPATITKNPLPVPVIPNTGGRRYPPYVAGKGLGKGPAGAAKVPVIPSVAEFDQGQMATDIANGVEDASFSTGTMFGKFIPKDPANPTGDFTLVTAFPQK